MSKVKLEKWEIELKELEDKYYPIHWFIENDEIKMFDKNQTQRNSCQAYKSIQKMKC